jgi:hypothetical protein
VEKGADQRRGGGGSGAEDGVRRQRCEKLHTKESKEWTREEAVKPAAAAAVAQLQQRVSNST